MAPITIASFLSLTLILPSAIALPFDIPFFNKGQDYESPWGHEPPQHHHWKSYPTYTLTASSEGIYPTAPSGYAFAVAPTGTGTGTAIGTGTGTAGYPTATGFPKRNLDERQFFSFPSGGLPTGFPTGFPTGLPTGFPTGFAFPTGTGTGFSLPTSFPDPPFDKYEGAKQIQQFGGGPRKDQHHYYPYAPVAPFSAGTPGAPPPAPTATAPSFTAPTAPSYTASGSGFPFPTFAH